MKTNLLKTAIYLFTLFSAVGMLEAPQTNQICICLFFFIVGLAACWKINN